jgi:uncharacterized protein YaeQ
VSGLDPARDVAQQAVTAVLHGDRDQASLIAADHPEPLELALVLLDLVAHVHCRWAFTLGLDDIQARAAWTEIVADIEHWRTFR